MITLAHMHNPINRANLVLLIGYNSPNRKVSKIYKVSRHTFFFVRFVTACSVFCIFFLNPGIYPVAPVALVSY